MPPSGDRRHRPDKLCRADRRPPPVTMPTTTARIRSSSSPRARCRAFDGRGQSLDLDVCGFQLVRHQTAVTDFADKTSAALYASEIEALILELTGADQVLVSRQSDPAVSPSARARPGRATTAIPPALPNVDISDETGKRFFAAALPRTVTEISHGPRITMSGASSRMHRRTFRSPFASARSLSGGEMIFADAIFDSPTGDWSFEGYVVAH